jgi:hypothetical protein
MPLNVTDNTIMLNFEPTTTELNFDLSTYDSTWIYWAVVMDFFDSYDGDAFYSYEVARRILLDFFGVYNNDIFGRA